MGASLLSGVSGLRSHQRLLDVVANNLANINTPGYKSARVEFSDLFSQTLDTGGASTTGIGGRNPVQLGMGVKTAGIETDFEQGTLSATGRVFDTAIEGDGFFALSDGKQNYYTRVGRFDVDSSNRLVHLGTGYLVLDVEGNSIDIPKNVTLPGQETSSVSVVGNLNANANGPLQEVMATSAIVTTDAAVITSSSAGPYALADGDSLTITANEQGLPQTFTFDSADFADITQATAQEVADVINATAYAFRAEVRDNRLMLVSNTSTSASSLQVADVTGTPAAALGLTTDAVTKVASTSTDLRDLASNVRDYVDGDSIAISGLDYDGTQVSGTFTFGAANDGTTMGDLVSKINEIFAGCTASIDSAGNILLTANNTGETNLSITLTDSAGDTGATTWSNHAFQTITPGGLGSTRSTSIRIYDQMGGSHVLTVLFRKESTNTWSATASVTDGEMLDASIEGIRFAEDGSFSQVVGTGLGDPGFEVRLPGIASAQVIQLDFGTSGGFDGLTQYGDSFSAAAIEQNGFGPGALSSVSIKSDGTIQGNFSNGQITDIAQIQVATFSNPAGLLKHGDNMYLPGANSGAAVAGAATTGGAGRISASTLESSNVDIALEFTRLITAQRGFQVNARTITTTDQMMQELANLIR